MCALHISNVCSIAMSPAKKYSQIFGRYYVFGAIPVYSNCGWRPKNPVTSEMNLVMVTQLVLQQTLLKINKQPPCQVLFEAGMFYPSQQRPKTE